MKVAVLPVYCNDAARVTTRTRDEIAAVFDAAVRYYDAQSGGRERLVYELYDWFELPLSGAESDALGFNAGDTIVPMFEKGKHVSLAGFEHFVLLIDRASAHGGAWRPNDPGHRYLHLSAPDLDPALLTHELGHLAGAGHGFLRARHKDIQYGDSFCVMGGESDKYSFADALGDQGPGMSGSMLHTCGWLDFASGRAAANLDLEHRAEAVVELAPLLGAPAPNSAGLPVVAWSDGLAPGQRLSIEYRVRGGWDRGLPSSGSASGWIVAHLTDGGGSGTSPVLIGSMGATAGAVLELPMRL